MSVALTSDGLGWIFAVAGGFVHSLLLIPLDCYEPYRTPRAENILDFGLISTK